MSILVVALEVWRNEGGIQQVNRSIVRFLNSPELSQKLTILSLFDSQTDMEKGLGPLAQSGAVKFYGHSGAKYPFLVNFIWLLMQPGLKLVFLAHITLAPLGLFCKLRRYPYMLIAHGVEVWKPPKFLTRLALSCVEAGFCVSSYTRTKASQFDPNFNIFQICHNGVDVKTDIIDLGFYNDLKKQWSGRKVILIVGRVELKESYKGHIQLIQALLTLKSKYPEILLVIVGRGSGLPFLQKMTQVNQLNSHVMFAGFVPNEQLSSYYALCDIFAMPSQGEGFGLVYLEAMAHQKPCIGGNDDGAQEVINNNETGFLVSHTNIAQLTDRLDQLLSDKKLYQKMGEAGYQRYLNHFTESKFHQRLSRIFEPYLR